MSRPLQHIRDTLRNTVAARPSDKLRFILQHRHKQLRAPWKLDRHDAGSSSTALTGSSVTISDNVVLQVTESSRQLATVLANTAGVSPVEAYIVAAGYESYTLQGGSGGKGKGREEGLLSWYAEECLALPDIVLLLVDLAYGEAGEEEGEIMEEWKTLAVDTQEAYWADADQYIQGLFRGWAGLATRQLGQAQRKEHALFW
jgi:hypothetical protein